ncbi:HYCCI protein, partial [Amia calva]|nr:HYCCI protein [Amia calva]
TLPETAISSYAASLKDKTSLVPALYKVIRESQSELLEPVCHQLFEFYRSGEAGLRRFTLQFLPELIWCCLSLAASRDLHRSGCIEALLLGIYNLEIVDKDGQSKVLTFTVPSLSKPSVYHEPSTIGSLALTEGALAKHGLSRVVFSGPHPQRETFTAQNSRSKRASWGHFICQLSSTIYPTLLAIVSVRRQQYALVVQIVQDFVLYRFEVLTFLLLCYNAALSYMSTTSLQSLCQLSSRISTCGYPRQHVRKYKGINTRMSVSSEFLVQLITGIYYALYNGEADMASKALDDVLYRAQLELYPEALLVGNAIKSSLHGGALKSNNEGTRCIQVEITPTSSRISRNAVTSLSIRGHRWKRHESPENSIDAPDSGAVPVPEISVTGVSGERVLNGEMQRHRAEGEAQGVQEPGSDSRADAVDLASPEELMEISEVDEGFCSRAAPSCSPPVIVISSSFPSGRTPGKSQRRVGGSRAGKEREGGPESCRDQLSRKQAQRAMSENLELLSLKRLTLTTSQSLPKPGSLSLARTASAVFSKSFEQVSNVFGAGNPTCAANAPPSETNRYSACSLQEDRLAYVAERAEHLSPNPQHKQQRSPSISIQLSTDL